MTLTVYIVKSFLNMNPYIKIRNISIIYGYM
jgi:hypothetical protein